MVELPRLSWAEVLGLLLVVAAAAALRAGYLHLADDGAQTPPVRVTSGVDGETPPLADKDEDSAAVAPGYPWLLAICTRYAEQPHQVLRWTQCGLGSLSALCYFFFARRAFRSGLVGFLAGLLCAVYPFWIFATAEISDAVLASFLLAAVLALGTRASQVGGAATSLLFGLALAALAMVRAACLPFALIAFLWFLWRCRLVRWGWFAGLLAFIGFANGLAPWVVRNARVFGEPVPVVTSAYLHLWMGNNPRTVTGARLDEDTLRSTFGQERLEELQHEPNQARRYGMLAQDVLDEVQRDPAGTVGRRITATEAFFLGQDWLAHGKLAEVNGSGPDWLVDDAELALRGSLLALLLLGVLGWRWTYAWSWHARLATLATIWIPIPYILGHADVLHGPRLPLDGVLLCYVAYALCAWVPGAVGRPVVESPVVVRA